MRVREAFGRHYNLRTLDVHLTCFGSNFFFYLPSFGCHFEIIEEPKPSVVEIRTWDKRAPCGPTIKSDPDNRYLIARNDCANK